MKVILAILSVSLAYSSGFENQDWFDQYLAINHSQELNRPDLSADFLHTQITEVKALVETAKQKRLAAEHWDMEDALALAANPGGRQRGNKRSR